MTDQRIILSEPEEHKPYGSSIGYLIKYYREYHEERPHLTLSIEVSGREIDGHYILTKSVTERPEDYGFQVIGISHTVEEADKRLYEKAKEIAREMAKGHHVRDLEDLTRHFQSLPRGGK